MLVGSAALQAQDTNQYVLKENYKREIVIGNKRYRVYNNWVAFGAGPGYHSANPRTQFALGLNFNFHIKKLYFNLGGLMSGDEFGVWNNYTAHAGFIPWRSENENRNIAVIGGISYTQGYDFAYAGHYYSDRWDRVGVYAELHYAMKAQYSVGAGPSLFVDINDKRIIAGIRLDGYLSGAYRGYARGAGPRK